jgi:hypothetical protein
VREVTKTHIETDGCQGWYTVDACETVVTLKVDGSKWSPFHLAGYGYIVKHAALKKAISR